MSQAEKSLFVFGIYLSGLGVVLLFFPNLLLRFFGVPPTNEVWIRINGMFVICSILLCSSGAPWIDTLYSLDSVGTRRCYFLLDCFCAAGWRSKGLAAVRLG